MPQQPNARSVLYLARDFSPYPAGRFRKDGPFSGEAFREDFLRPKLEGGGEVEIVIDDVAGLPSSFWEEVFGGLVRRGYLEPEEVRRRIFITTSDPPLKTFQRLAYVFAEEAAP